MEAESSVVLNSAPQEAGTGHVILSEGADSTSIEELESISSIPASSSSETLEELVDQMEIEISDHEGEGSMGEGGEGSEEEVDEGVASGDATKTKTEVEEEVITSEKIETSTRIATGHGSSGEAEKLGGHVRILEDEGGSGTGGRRRKYSSSYEKIEFPVISMERQLSNEDIVELMSLLRVSILQIY